MADSAVPVEIAPLLRLLLNRLASTELGEDSRTLNEAMVRDVMQPTRPDLRVRTPSSPLLRPIVTALTALQESPAHTLSLEQWADRLEFLALALSCPGPACGGPAGSRLRD
ncbi:hypothetical protein [Corynebacterium sp. A21]|uniref:hypothetical protein n=1 Tax=Corynebacterium sp. A21 TaxID=3457318 RepID=UPI003FD1E363